MQTRRRNYRALNSSPSGDEESVESLAVDSVDSGTFSADAVRQRLKLKQHRVAKRKSVSSHEDVSLREPESRPSSVEPLLLPQSSVAEFFGDLSAVQSRTRSPMTTQNMSMSHANTALMRPKINLPTWSGPIDNIRIFLTQLAGYCELTGMTPRLLHLSLYDAFRGPAKLWYVESAFVGEQILSASDIVTALSRLESHMTDKFYDVQESLKQLNLLVALKMQRSESIESYHSRWLKICGRFPPSKPPPEPNLFFLNGLPQAARNLLNSMLNGPSNSVLATLSPDRLLKEAQAAMTPAPFVLTRDPAPDPTSRGRESRHRSASPSPVRGRRRSRSPSRQSRAPAKRPRWPSYITCFSCNESGHKAFECPNKDHVSPRPSRPNRERASL
jgi:hypothetical protein